MYETMILFVYMPTTPKYMTMHHDTSWVEICSIAPLFEEGFVIRRNIMEGPHKKGTLQYMVMVL